eukprot:CAMPEP_0178380242 /NCGR_PEP_ID=MMETSP0689_2-20121128/5359_1 /TAXON_ID=160604 /ORGANISM="Amphidinium massartii, Strain CS-259" /LENGTH=516 /DNA_ID=CAMNT_0020000373 /DNA_START=40 /DNA_END=1587 /DNA_ORIENTATION=+
MGEKSVLAQLLQTGAYLSLWVLGLCGILRLALEFEATLKPLVLAILLVSLLEWVVQCWEFVFFKLSIALYVLFDKFTVVVAVCFYTSIICLSGTRWPEYSDWATRSLDKQKARFCKWEALRRPWDPAFAGANQLSRFLSVTLTITLLVLLASVASYAVAEGVQALVSGMAEYRDQSLRIVRWGQKMVNELPDMLPISEENRETLKLTLHNAGQDLQPMKLVSAMENQILSVVTGLLDSTSIWATQFVFFLLYVFLFLFCPLHINADDEWRQRYELDRSYTLAYKARQLFKKMSSLLAPSPPVADGSDPSGLQTALLGDPTVSVGPSETVAPLRRSANGATVELQHRLYKIMWQYGLLMVVVNSTFAVLTYLLLWYLNIPLAILVGVICFFLAFIPELGAIISVILPLPIIILMPPQVEAGEKIADDDPFPDWEIRLKMLLGAVIGMFLNKLLVANVLYPLMMGRSKVLSGALTEDQDAGETHPVILLFIVVVFGEVWGATGMLISVPMVSFIRLTV